MRRIEDEFIRQMGLTHREFFRTLPSAVGSYLYKTVDNGVVIELNNGFLRIELATESVRKIASIKIAQTDVSFYFKDVNADEKSSFMLNFDKRFQRGGG